MDFKKLYEPIPNVEAYLERICMDMRPDTTKEVLDRLIYLHQCHIPFENMDVYFAKKEISPAVSDVYEKLVVKKRGGFCFEQNNLFHAVLKELGFEVFPCQCKMMEGDGPYYQSLHRGTIAKIDGDLYYCDVGVGGPIAAGALKLEENLTQTYAGDDFVLSARPDGWWELARMSDDDENVMMRIHPIPYDPVDFISMTHYCCCHTQKEFNRFTDNLILNIRTENGYIGIFNKVMKQKENGVVKKTVLENKEQLLTALYEKFHLTEEVAPMVLKSDRF